MAWVMNPHWLRAALTLVTAACFSACHSSSSGSSTGLADTGSNSMVVTSVDSVDAIVNSGAVTASLTFNASESAPAANLTVTAGLSSLPAGWSGPSTFSCASVGTGSGCVLDLTYTPTTVAKGALVIKYSFTDGSGVAQSSSATIDYAGTTNNNVVATPAPSGQVVAMLGGGAQPMAVTFTTDDGNPATALTVTTNLLSLPSGWASSAHTLTCASVSTGSACRLPLSFEPKAVGSGTLTLSYEYANDFGTAKTGVLHIPYAATVHDNVVGTASASPVYSPVGSGPVSVPVTFTTDDGNPATHLVVTSSLTGLPAGWSSTASSFTCGTVSTGTGCRLPLSFTAAIGATGTLQLAYGYLDNAGTAKTGTVSVAYTSTTHDNIVGAASIAGTVRVAVDASQAVAVTFTTDDGNVATAFHVTSGLGSLPAYWTGPGSLSCAAVSTGTGCQLSLTFAPLATASGTVTLGFSYVDSAGTAKTGTVSVPYAVKHVYVTDASGVYVCSIVSGGALSGCTLTALSRVDSSSNPLQGAYGIAFSGDYAYVNQYPDASVSICAVTPSDGTLTGCTTFAFTGGASYGYSVFASSAYLYIENSSAQYCPIGANGALGSCSNVTGGVTEYSFGIYSSAGLAYVSPLSGNVQVCAVSAGGDLTPCVDSGIADGGALTVDGNFAFLTPWGSNAVKTCSILGNGMLGACSSSTVTGAGTGGSVGTAVFGENAYSVASTDVEHCAVNTLTGALSACAVSDGGATFVALGGIASY
jgi:hypothetical protein